MIKLVSVIWEVEEGWDALFFVRGRPTKDGLEDLKVYDGRDRRLDPADEKRLLADKRFNRAVDDAFADLA